MTAVQRLRTALADRYRIERELGAGGMATVYLALDLRHDRNVALKVLRPELAAVIGADRFLKEIKVTANLQHPHILGLIDSGEVDGILYYVMPFVEGESLRDRLLREKQLPVEDAVRITREVASALDYAHRHHVIHRDIKPENILLHDNQALVADFGIALAVSSAGGTRMTETGMSLGTPHYMSPEQAMGEREITARSDVYALGCVLYEMLVGEPPFTGPTAQAIVAKVMTERPRTLMPQRHTVPPHVEAAALKALEKLPADRFATAGAFAQALDAAAALPVTRDAVPAPARAPRRRMALLGGVLVSIGAALGLVVGRAGAPAGSDGPAARLEIAVPGFRFHGLRNMALSGDGTAIVYYGAGALGGTNGLHLRRLDRFEITAIPGAENAANPVVSPDGRELLLVRFGGGVSRIAFGGGEATTVAEVPPTPHVVWSDQGEIVYTWTDGSLWRMSVRGGTPKLVAAPDTASGERLLQITDVLPGGRTALVAAGSGGGPVGPLHAIDLRSGDRRRLLDVDVRGGWYAGHETLIYTRLDGSINGVAFDPVALTTSGESVPLGGPVSATPIGLSRLSVSRTGSVLYAPLAPAELVWVSRDGTTRPALDRQGEFHNPKVSPDGGRIVLDINEPTGRDVWVYSLSQGTLTRVTFDNDGHDAIWSRDGRSVVYASVRDGVSRTLRSRLDGSPGELLGTGVAAPGGWTAEGVLIGSSSGAAAAEGWNLSAIAPDGSLTPYLATQFSEAFPALSPDGVWLAYASDESRRLEVYIRRVDGVGGRLQVSTDGGTEPVWSRDGRELHYRRTHATHPEMFAARLALAGSAVVTSRQALFGWGDFENGEPHPNYDVAPDGRGFIMIRRAAAAKLVLIQNAHRLVHREPR